MHRPPFVAASALLLITLASCSSSSSPSTPASDAGSSPDAGGTGVPMVTDHGRVLDFDTNKPLAGVTVTENGTTTTTDAQGHWSISVPPGIPSRVSLHADGYITAHLPEEIYDADNDRGDVPLPALGTFKLGQDAQRGYDATLASTSVVVRTLPSCASDEGATLKVLSPDGTKQMYFRGGFPSSSASAVVSGEDPAVTVYNVPLGQDLVLELDHPTCKMVPFPAKVGSATFTGKVDFEAGDANSVVVVFLQ